LQSKLANETKVEFEKQVKATLKNCQKFINKVIETFNDKETPKEEITNSEKLHFLQYLYGNIM